MYYNTTNETGQTLKSYNKIARSQDQRILGVFQANKLIGYGASDIEKIFPNMPLTSIRRALNSLERIGRIYKTGDKQQGRYSRDENVYKLLTI